MKQRNGQIGPFVYGAKAFDEMMTDATHVVVTGADGGEIVFVRSTSKPAGVIVGDHAWGTKSWRGEPVA